MSGRASCSPPRTARPASGTSSVASISAGPSSIDRVALAVGGALSDHGAAGDHQATRLASAKRSACRARALVRGIEPDGPGLAVHLAQGARRTRLYSSRPLDDTRGATIEWYLELIEAGAFADSRVSGLSRWADSMRIASRFGLLTPVPGGAARDRPADRRRRVVRRVVEGRWRQVAGTGAARLGRKYEIVVVSSQANDRNPPHAAAQRRLRGLASARAPARGRDKLGGGRARARPADRRAARTARRASPRATFFVLGMAARAYPELLERIVVAGHEIGCHGDAHVPVHTQTPQEFAADLHAAKSTIEQLTGRTPVGYRAPAFSIRVIEDWAYGCSHRRGSSTTRARTTRRRSAIAPGGRRRPPSPRASRQRAVGVPRRGMAHGEKAGDPGRGRLLLVGATDARVSKD